jgi:hypothetical protein
MIASAPYPVFAAAIRRPLVELIPLAQEVSLDLGLTLHAFDHIRELEGHPFDSGPMHEEAQTTLQVFLTHEANRL